MRTLAVVMATFNGERFLDEQLQSIARQDRRPDLLVISDDGSTDDTLEIASRFARGAPFETRLLSGPRTGLADNFWSAAHTIDADLIAWADQDDIWLPAKLGVCENALAAHDAAFVSHSARTVDSQGRELGHRYPNYVKTRILSALEGDPWHVPSGFASMFLRELCQGIAFENRPRSHQTKVAMNHDHIVSLRAFATRRRVELVDELALYRQHGKNAAGDPTARGLEAIRTRLRSRQKDFVTRAEIAREYEAYIRSLTADEATGRYFDDLCRRAERRAAIYTATTRSARLAQLVDAARGGTYASRQRGGAGARGLLRDATLGVWTLS